MKIWGYTFILAVSLSAPVFAQESVAPPPQPTPRPIGPEPSTTNTVMRTNSMNVLDDRTRLGPNDFVSFRVVEDRDSDPQRLRVNDNGQLEVPYIGLVPAAGKTSRELAYNIKSALEKEYYYHATVIIAVDHVSEKSRGRVYLTGSVKGPGPQEIPPDEEYTLSKAIIRAGGFGDFADKGKVRITRKSGEKLVVNVKRVIEQGRNEEDIILQPEDRVFVPQRVINW